MANYGAEAADLAKLGAALVINMGTVTPEGLDNYKKALRAYNAAGRPVVFDPVGYVSRTVVLLPELNLTCIKSQCGSHSCPQGSGQVNPFSRLHRCNQGQRERDQDLMRHRR